MKKSETTTETPLALNSDVSRSACKHTWDRVKGIKKEGKPWIGLKSKWIRTCTKCGYMEEFSRGVFNGWYEHCG